jgi:NAD(P)-dependent dehydrogenase (short-subunit alcohol dehydrogenase family)
MSLSGVMTPPIEMLTEDGYDLQFGTNVLGHFYFTKIIMPALLAGAAQSPDGTARIVNTSSNAHWFGSLDYNTFKDSPARKKMSTMALYAQSKLVSFVCIVLAPFLNSCVHRAMFCLQLR